MLHLPWVIAVAAAAGFVGDTLFYALGRWRGPAVLARWPQLNTHAERVRAGLARWGAGVVVGLRFAYGLRVAGPILIGASGMSAPHFMLWNAVGAVLWATLVAGAGWFFGEAAQALLGRIHHLEGWLALALLGVALAYALWQHRRGRAAGMTK